MLFIFCIFAKLINFKLKIVMAKFSLNKEETEKLIRLYVDEKISTLKLAEVFGTSKPTINRLLKENNVEMRPSGRHYLGKTKAERDKIYAQKNKEKIAEKQKRYAEDNKEKLKEYRKKYQQENREKIREQKKAYRDSLRASDPFKKFHKETKQRMFLCVANGLDDEIFDHLPYNIEDVRKLIESMMNSRMSWSNYGDWEIYLKSDKYKYTSYKDSDFQLCWSLSNLNIRSIKNKL